MQLLVVRGLELRSERAREHASPCASGNRRSGHGLPYLTFYLHIYLSLTCIAGDPEERALDAHGHGGLMPYMRRPIEGFDDLARLPLHISFLQQKKIVYNIK